jgi:hypothetical protein
MVLGPAGVQRDMWYDVAMAVMARPWPVLLISAGGLAALGAVFVTKFRNGLVRREGGIHVERRRWPRGACRVRWQCPAWMMVRSDKSSECFNA